MPEKIIIVHGPTGAGKSTLAEQLRLGQSQPRALIALDAIYNEMLGGEGTQAKHEAVALIELLIRRLTADEYNIVVEGVLRPDYFRPMFTRLNAEFDITYIYLAANVETSVKRHAGRTKERHNFGEDKVREWHTRSEPLGFANEKIIHVDGISAEEVLGKAQASL